MKWTITMTEEELHRKTIVEQAIAKRITQKEGAARGSLTLNWKH